MVLSHSRGRRSRHTRGRGRRPRGRRGAPRAVRERGALGAGGSKFQCRTREEEPRSRPGTESAPVGDRSWTARLRFGRRRHTERNPPGSLPPRAGSRAGEGQARGAFAAAAGIPPSPGRKEPALRAESGGSDRRALAARQHARHRRLAQGGRARRVKQLRSVRCGILPSLGRGRTDTWHRRPRASR